MATPSSMHAASPPVRDCTRWSGSRHRPMATASTSRPRSRIPSTTRSLSPSSVRGRKARHGIRSNTTAWRIPGRKTSRTPTTCVTGTVRSACGWKAREWNFRGWCAGASRSRCSGRLRRKGKQILLRRPLHALLVVLLPDLRPGSPIGIRQRVFECVTRRFRRGIAVHRKDVRHTLHHDQRLVFIEPAQPVPGLHDPDRVDISLLVIEHGLVPDTDQLATGILARCVDLDRLQLAAELAPAVRHPPLYVGSPGDQRLTVPETDGFAEPLRNV